jgi:DNA-binding transcriptional LysR family regulator
MRELKTLVAVAREGTFAAAGDRIGLTQAAVSAQMARLESRLGFALFDRAGRAARLNRMGRQILSRAQELIRLYDGLASDSAGQPAGARVAIGAIASLQRSLLPDALAKFHRQFPSCRTRVIPGLSIELVNLVDAGDIDMAAVIRPPFSLQSDLCWTMLAREPFRLIAPRGAPGDDWAELLAGQPFIRYDRASFGGRQVDRFLRQMHFSVREVCEVDELEALVKLVANGVGVALAPQTAAQRRWPSGVRALDLGAHTFHRDVGLIHRAREIQSEPIRALIRLFELQAARASFPREPAKPNGHPNPEHRN